MCVFGFVLDVSQFLLIPIDTMRQEGTSALHLAAREGNVEIARMILQQPWVAVDARSTVDALSRICLQ